MSAEVRGSQRRGAACTCGVDKAPANLGGLCAKGAQLGPTIRSHDRLTKPQLRISRHDAFQEVDWNTSLRYIAEIFRNILNVHGPEAVAFYGSGQLDTESVYVINVSFLQEAISAPNNTFEFQ